MRVKFAVAIRPRLLPLQSKVTSKTFHCTVYLALIYYFYQLEYPEYPYRIPMNTTSL